MGQKQYLRHGAVGCIFKGNKTVEFSDANNIEHAAPVFSFDIATVMYVFHVTIVAHY